jgi:hypothetical protein
MKKLVIINGVTGAVGTACLARFSREKNIVIYGLSRKGFDIKEFLVDSLLPQSTNIFSIGNITDQKDCEAFVRSINLESFESIIYVHAVGYYPFELDDKGNIFIANDKNGDGIDDRVTELSYNAFFGMVNSLLTLDKPINALVIGSVSDKHEPEVHASWWKTMRTVRETMQQSKKDNVSFSILNISSVICPHEILTRPYVFQSTNADASFWLMPNEVADEIYLMTNTSTKGFSEKDLFHQASYYEDNYFTGAQFTERKKSELGLK